MSFDQLPNLIRSLNQIRELLEGTLSAPLLAPIETSVLIRELESPAIRVTEIETP
jgi:hypothetical protein